MRMGVKQRISDPALLVSAAQILCRPGDIKAKLQALSVVSARPQWRIITDAIDCYVRERPEPERRMVDELVSRSRSRSARQARKIDDSLG